MTLHKKRKNIYQKVDDLKILFYRRFKEHYVSLKNKKNLRSIWSLFLLLRRRRRFALLTKASSQWLIQLTLPWSVSFTITIPLLLSIEKGRDSGESASFFSKPKVKSSSSLSSADTLVTKCPTGSVSQSRKFRSNHTVGGVLSALLLNCPSAI